MGATGKHPGGKGRACVLPPHLTAPPRRWRLLGVEPSLYCRTPGLRGGGGLQYGAVWRSGAAEGQCGAAAGGAALAAARPSAWLPWPLSPLRPRRPARLGLRPCEGSVPVARSERCPLLRRTWRPLPAPLGVREGSAESLWVWCGGMGWRLDWVIQRASQP